MSGFEKIPFMRELGAHLVRAENGEAEVSLELTEHHTNSWGVGHGGVVMSLLDVAMARAGMSLAGAEPGADLGSVTVEMKTSFFRPARGHLMAKGRVLHRSTTMSYCEAELRDAHDRLIAKASGTFKYLSRRDVAHRL